MTKKGSVSGRLFRLESRIAGCPTTPSEAGEDDGVGRDADRRGRRLRGRVDHQQADEGQADAVPDQMAGLAWGTDYNTWEFASRIDPLMVRAFEGLPPKRSRLAAPEQFKRGAGCARARLSETQWRRRTRSAAVSCRRYRWSAATSRST